MNKQNIFKSIKTISPILGSFIIAFALFYFAPSTGNKSIVSNFSIKQLPSLGGEPIRWIKTVSVSDINRLQHLVEIPSIANDIKISTSTVSNNKIQTSSKLTNEDRIKLSKLSNERSKSEASLALAELVKKQNTKGFFASISRAFSKVGSSFATVDEASTEPEMVTVDVSAVVDIPEEETPVVIEEVINEESTNVVNDVVIEDVVDELASTTDEVVSTIEEVSTSTELVSTTTEEIIITDVGTTTDEVATTTDETDVSTTTLENGQAEDIATSTLENGQAEEEITTGGGGGGSSNEDIKVLDELASTSIPTFITSTTSTSTTATSTDLVTVEYETPAPTIAEATTDTGKVVTVSSVEGEIPITNVLAFTNIPEIYKVGQEDKIKIKWSNNGDQNVTFKAYDLDNNGKLDYVEWTVPHLSVQTFEIIFISKAFQLDANKEILADIYDTVKTQDGNYAPLSDGQYVRVTFEKILTNANDITIYAKPASSTPVTIEAYTTDTNQLVATFNIDHEGLYKKLIPELGSPTDVFDLKIIGEVEVDYVVDPTEGSYALSFGGSSYVDLTTPIADSGVDMTYSLWVKDFTASNALIGGTGVNVAYFGLWYSDNNLYFGSNTDGVQINWMGMDGLTWTGWHLVTLTESYTEGVGRTATLYIDGAQYQDSKPITNIVNIKYFGMGADSSWFLNGGLDEINIWNRTLSAPEILGLYNSGTGVYGDKTVAPFNSGLVAGYHFDEGTGTAVSDFSDSANNGTLISGPTWIAGEVAIPSTPSVSKYWVGSTSSWNDTNNWSLTSGGAGGAGVPEAGQPVTFDSADTTNCDIDTNVTTGTLTIATGYTGTITQTSSYTITATSITQNDGILTLINSNTITSTTLNAGTLNINSAGAIGAGSLIIVGGTIDNTSVSAVTLSGNNAQTWSGDITFGGTNDLNLGTANITLPANRIITTNNTAKLTVGGIVSGAYSMTKAGTGELSLTGANTFTGGVILNVGTLTISNTLSTSGFTQSNGTFNGGTGAITLSGNLSISDGIFNSTSGTLSISGDFTQDNGVFNGGTNSITLTGDLLINSGTFNSTSGNLTVSGNFTNSDNFNANGGTLTLNGATTSLDVGVSNLNDVSIFSSVANGLVAHYRMNDTSGTTVDDNTSNNFDVTASQDTSILTTSGKINTALAFSGENNIDASVIKDTFSGTNNWTISFWARMSNSSSHAGLFGFSNYVIYSYWSNSGRIAFNTPAGEGQYSMPISGGEWTHLTFMRDGSSWKTYINGVLATSPLTSSASVDTTGLSFLLGSLPSVNNQERSLDDIRIYNVALTQSEIDDIYNLGSGNEVDLSISTISLQNPVTFLGDFTISANSIFTTNNHNINLSGNLTNSGTFNTGSSTITFNGENQSITGSNTFYNFVKSVTSSSTLTFAANSTTNISNSLTLSGIANNLLSLISSISGTKWNINVSNPATVIANYLNIKDSTASGKAIAPMNSVDSGNNTNWTFNSAPNIPTLVSPSNASYTNDNTPTLSAYYSDPNTGDTGTTNYRISSTTANDCLNNLNIVNSGTSTETVSDSATTTYTPSSTIGLDGTYYWCAQNNDGSLASSFTSMGSFILDITVPTTTVGLDQTRSSTFTQTSTSSDTTSGIASYLWSGIGITFGTTTASSTTISATTDGTYTIRLTVTDNAGNSTYDEYILTWDASAPTVSSVSPADDSYISRASQLVTFTISENGDCRLAITNKSYDDMSADISCTSNSLLISCTLPSFTSGTKDIYIACNDSYNNSDSTSSTTHITYRVRGSSGGTTTSEPITTTSQTTPDNLFDIRTSNRTDDRIVTLNITPNTDTKLIIISNNPDFNKAIIIPVQTTYEYNLCGADTTCPDGDYTVYARSLDASNVASSVVSTSVTLSTTPTIEKIIDIITSIIPVPEVTLPPVSVTEEDQTNLNNNIGEIVPSEMVNLINLPVAFKNIINKFPTITSLNNDLSMGGVLLPGLAEYFGLSNNISISNFTQTQSNKVPTNLIFVRTFDESIDLNVKLSVSNEGFTTQKLNTIQGQLLKFAVKPESKAKRIDGYLMFQESYVKQNASVLDAVEERELVVAKFDYKDSGNGIWTADVSSPYTLGQYELKTIISYEDKTKEQRELSMIVLVDPEGYIYEKIGGDKEIRIANAVSSIYWKNPETSTYELWPGDNFKQKNPQTTDVTGRYSFLVPPGDYYLTVTALGYSDYQSESFKVEESKGVFMNVEMKGEFGWGKVFKVQNIFTLIVSIALIYFVTIFIIRRGRKINY
ncbi:MAG: LamG-like jellyroll fold domain-containing protein [Candidatus Paceibacterota bacterium]|jgi:autotransporter-associated beta strand protein